MLAYSSRYKSMVSLECLLQHRKCLFVTNGELTSLNWMPTEIVLRRVYVLPVCTARLRCF
jgi:hypothetical protein